MIHPSSDRVRKLIRHPPDAGLADTENCNSPSIRPRLPKPALAWGFIPLSEIGLKWEAIGAALGNRRLRHRGARTISVGQEKVPRYEVG
jgi:hypothetical protein